jgi:hypothetical protein
MINGGELPSYKRQYEIDKQMVIDSYRVAPLQGYRSLNQIVSSDIEEQARLLIKTGQIDTENLSEESILTLFREGTSYLENLLQGCTKEATELLTMFAAGMFEGVGLICKDVLPKDLLKPVTRYFLTQCRIKPGIQPFDYVSVLTNVDRSIEVDLISLPTFNFSVEDFMSDLRQHSNEAFAFKRWTGHEQEDLQIVMRDYYFLIGVLAGSLFAQDLPELFGSSLEPFSGYRFFVQNYSSGQTPQGYLWHSNYKLFTPEIFNPNLGDLTQEEYDKKVDYIIRVNCYSEPRMFTALCGVNASANALGYNNIFAKDLFTAASVKRDRLQEEKILNN